MDYEIQDHTYLDFNGAYYTSDDIIIASLKNSFIICRSQRLCKSLKFINYQIISLQQCRNRLETKMSFTKTPSNRWLLWVNNLLREQCVTRRASGPWRPPIEPFVSHFPSSTSSSGSKITDIIPFRPGKGYSRKVGDCIWRCSRCSCCCCFNSSNDRPHELGWLFVCLVRTHFPVLCVLPTHSLITKSYKEE